MSATANSDDLPQEIDFGGGTRGKCFRAGATINLPVYLDAEVRNYWGAIAAKKGVQVFELANDLFKTEIAIFESMK